MSTYHYIEPATLASWLEDGAEIALIDVREEGLFGAGHALLACNVPYSRLELDFPALVPRRATRVVLIGEERPDGRSTAERAAERLAALGYTGVQLLAGGSAAWQAAGQPLFQGIYVPSKAFAECVELAFHTPTIQAAELHRLQQQGADLIVLDSRTTAEYARYHVPGAISCPGAELVLRFDDLVKSPATQVVVSCAGRTRGIIGAQALINAGVPNPVRALQGGTQDWKLAGLAIESGATAVHGALGEAAHAVARVRGDDLARRFDVPEISLEQLHAWQADDGRTTYLFDVRSPAEYGAARLPGATGVAGGQLVQTLDKWVATRGARVVLVDDLGVRAQVTAHWLRQLGWAGMRWCCAMPLTRRLRLLPTRPRPRPRSPPKKPWPCSPRARPVSRSMPAPTTARPTRAARSGPTVRASMNCPRPCVTPRRCWCLPPMAAWPSCMRAIWPGPWRAGCRSLQAARRNGARPAWRWTARLNCRPTRNASISCSGCTTATPATARLRAPIWPGKRSCPRPLDPPRRPVFA